MPPDLKKARTDSSLPRRHTSPPISFAGYGTKIGRNGTIGRIGTPGLTGTRVGISIGMIGIEPGLGFFIFSLGLNVTCPVSQTNGAQFFGSGSAGPLGLSRFSQSHQCT